MEDLERSPNIGVQSLPPAVQNSQIATSQSLFSGASNTFGPNLFIKLQDNNFLSWNQQVEEFILSHKLHKMVVSTQILLMFKTEHDRIFNVVSKNYESWIVQDQTLFTWLLSMISEGLLPCVLPIALHLW